MNTLNPELTLIQRLAPKPAYRTNELNSVAGSRATAYRMLGELVNLGFADKPKKGFFTLRDSVFQPFGLWPYLTPSLQALKQSRRFGKLYTESDVTNARRIIQGIETLDYRAYDLTKLQHPINLYVYVDDLDAAARELRTEGFHEGKKGRVILLPRIGEFENEVQRVYLDCLAAGGRYVLDAVAINLLHGPELRIKANFPIEQIEKVKEDLPRN